MEDLLNLTLTSEFQFGAGCGCLCDDASDSGASGNGWDGADGGHYLNYSPRRPRVVCSALVTPPLSRAHIIHEPSRRCPRAHRGTLPQSPQGEAPQKSRQTLIAGPALGPEDMAALRRVRSSEEGVLAPGAGAEVVQQLRVRGCPPHRWPAATEARAEAARTAGAAPPRELAATFRPGRAPAASPWSPGLITPASREAVRRRVNTRQCAPQRQNAAGMFHYYCHVSLLVIQYSDTYCLNQLVMLLCY